MAHSLESIDLKLRCEPRTGGSDREDGQQRNLASQQFGTKSPRHLRPWVTGVRTFARTEQFVPDERGSTTR